MKKNEVRFIEYTLSGVSSDRAKSVLGGTVLSLTVESELFFLEYADRRNLQRPQPSEQHHL
ncbi:hypothetical protein QM565_26285 [Geitlerinema splendidum]|nr:hypothetical protein [Geitlerinema splendidum]